MPVALDLDTLMICSMLVTTTCGMLFLIEAYRRRESVPSRWWGIGFLCTTTVPVFYIASSNIPGLAWLVAVGNGMVITGMSMIWVGAQAFNGRRPAVIFALMGPLLAMAAAAFAPGPFNAWSGGIVFLSLFAAYSLATGVEFWNHTGFRYRSAIMLAGSCGLDGIFYAARAVALWAYGPDDPFFQTYFGSEIATVVVMLIIIISSFSLAALGKEQFEVALHQAATRDSLTNTLNRREFMRRAELELRRLAATQAPASVLVVDLDFFKKINDTYGHPVGDRVLVLFAETAAAILGSGDLLCRYGGEEFVVLLPGTDEKGARIIAEQIRTRFAEIALATSRGMLRPTVSVGMTTVTAGDCDLWRLIANADDALYDAKAAGRNQVSALAKAA